MWRALSVRQVAASLRARVPQRPTLRLYHEGENLYGYRRPRKFELPAFTEEELANRNQHSNLVRLAAAYRSYGHLQADLDPLGMQPKRHVEELDLSLYGITDLNQKVKTAGILHVGFESDPTKAKKEVTVAELIEHLKSTYAGRIAFEFKHLPSMSERRWFAHMVESLGEHEVPADEKMNIYGLIAKSEIFDSFMAKRYPQVKRYGLEGAESMIVALDTIFRTANQNGVGEIVLGMPHRGRLNLLTDVLKFPPAALFHKVNGNSELPAGVNGAGDVLSHLSVSTDLHYNEKPLHVSLIHNPSHLEAVNPVAMGKARAKQMDLYENLSKQTTSMDCSIGDRVLCIQIHGDAAFTGQGVVMESLGLSDLAHFSSGGSIHVIVNNQIGFTTPAQNARSSIYTSDVGKMINAPVIHVNGDHPEDVMRACQIASLYRHKFRRDVIIDLVTYRRWGHNELDEPAFTQPTMYDAIRSRKSVPALYEEKLRAEKVFNEAVAAKIRKDYENLLDEEFNRANSYVPQATHLQGKWNGLKMNTDRFEPETPTGVDIEVLRKIGLQSVTVPQGFIVHPRLEKSHIQARQKRMQAGEKLDWATAEALAFGSLMLEGKGVRICGQDVGRGTFSHRHVMLVDQKTEGIIVPLNELAPNQGKIEIANSSLSELAVLGFEYGMSMENPNLLDIWEAQFGDFFNGAQVIIDTFIASGESKWLRQSALTILLPHGFDGAGPEHSSCRVERFLQLSDEPFSIEEGAQVPLPNMQIVNCTTPAQYYHVLRRQMTRDFRKPLIVVAPKTLLRLSAAVSSLAEMGPGTSFQPVLGDNTTAGMEHRIDRVILCSGKLFYELDEQRQKNRITDTAIIRVEELSPFPFHSIKEEIEKYSNASKIAWVQEEPQNQGFWSFVEPRIRSVLPAETQLNYVGREASAVPAIGISKEHKKEVAKLYHDAFNFE